MNKVVSQVVLPAEKMIYELEMGEVAVITDTTIEKYIGLVVIGMSSPNKSIAFDLAHGDTWYGKPSIKVKPVQPGTIISFKANV